MHVPSNTTTAKAQVCKVALLHKQTVGKKTTPSISANADPVFCFCAEQHAKLEKESQAGQIAQSLFSGDGRKDVRNSLKLHQESFRFDIRKNFFTASFITTFQASKQAAQGSGGVPLLLEVFKRHGGGT